MSPRGEYRGRSLAWARKVKGEKPYFTSARKAMETDLVPRYPFDPASEPPLGADLFYAPGEDAGRHGDVGIYLGAGVVARLDKSGIPRAGQSRAYTCWANRISPSEES